jgi:hypothetical protein
VEINSHGLRRGARPRGGVLMNASSNRRAGLGTRGQRRVPPWEIFLDWRM